MILNQRCEHLPTSEILEVDSFHRTQRFDTVSILSFVTDKAYMCNKGDIIYFRYSTGTTLDTNREFYGIVRDRTLKSHTVIAYDYLTVLQKNIVNFDRNYLVGDDILMAIKKVITLVDTQGLIDQSHIHGMETAKFVSWEDNINGTNRFAWDVIKDLLELAIDSSNTTYVLPFKIWMEADKIFIDRLQDINDATNYPAMKNIDNNDLHDVNYREDEKAVTNVVTCIGDDVQITVEDLSSATNYSGANNYDFQRAHSKISYDDPNTDVLQEQAANQILLHREIRGEYDITPSKYFGLGLNHIVDISSDRLGLDGRFVVTGFTENHLLRTSITISGTQLSLADVI